MQLWQPASWFAAWDATNSPAAALASGNAPTGPSGAGMPLRWPYPWRKCTAPKDIWRAAWSNGGAGAARHARHDALTGPVCGLPAEFAGRHAPEQAPGAGTQPRACWNGGQPTDHSQMDGAGPMLARHRLARYQWFAGAGRAGKAGRWWGRYGLCSAFLCALNPALGSSRTKNTSQTGLQPLCSLREQLSKQD